MNVNGPQRAGAAGVEWTIKEGIPYHAPTLMKEVKEIVSAARKQAPRRLPPASRRAGNAGIPQRRRRE